MIQLDIEDGFLEEIKKENKERNVLEIKKEEIKSKKEKIIEEIKTTKDITTKKTKEKKVKDLEKEEKSTDEELKKFVDDFRSLTITKKKKVIGETFDIRTLNKFLEEEERPDIRLTLEKRIDEIQNAKVDETIDHPDSHLKVS
jgi:hypothetical protein